MIKRMAKAFLELEAAAVKEGLFIDYDITPAPGAFAIKCTATDIQGRRVCRFASDTDVTAAQEHAGYMALCTYFGKEVDENLCKAPAQTAETRPVNPKPDMAGTENKMIGGQIGQQQRPTQNQNTNAGRPQTAAHTQQRPEQRTEQRPQPNQPPVNQTGTQVQANQGRTQNAQRPQPQENYQQGNGMRGVQGSAPVQPNLGRPQQQANAQGMANSRQTQQPGTRQSAPQNQARPQQQRLQQTNGQGYGPGNGMNGMPNHPVQPQTATSVAQTGQTGQATQPSHPMQQPKASQQPAQNQQHMPPMMEQPPVQPQTQTQPQAAGEPEDIRVAVAIYKRREKNRISDLLKEESGRNILSCIYTKDKLTDDLQEIKPKVMAYLDFYKVPIADETFIKNGAM